MTAVTAAISALFMVLLTGIPADQPESNPGILLTGLQDARSIRVSTMGNLFIAEAGRNRILKTDLEGNRIDSLGRLGSGRYQFDTPVDVHPTNELKIYVADRNNHRIQTFDRRLQFLGTVSLSQRSGYSHSYRPGMLTVDYSGRLFFYDEQHRRTFRYDSYGQYDLSFELYSRDDRIIPTSMTILDDVLWVVDRRSDLLYRFSLSGSYLGFIQSPEPVVSIRSRGHELWVLGNRNLMQIDGTGEVLHRTALPDQTSEEASAYDWIDFAVAGHYAFLLDRQSVVRLTNLP